MSSSESGSDGGGGDKESDLPAILQDFAAAPRGFALGLVLTPLLSGLEDLQLEILGLIELVFLGTGPGTEGLLGIADVWLIIRELAVTTGGTVGSAVLTALGIPVQAGLDIARDAGLPGLIVLALLIGLVVNLYAAYIRAAIEFALDFIPGGGSLIN